MEGSSDGRAATAQGSASLLAIVVGRCGSKRKETLTKITGAGPALSPPSRCRDAFEQNGFPIPSRPTGFFPCPLSIAAPGAAMRSGNRPVPCERSTEAVGKEPAGAPSLHWPRGGHHWSASDRGAGHDRRRDLWGILSRGMRWADFSGWFDGGWLVLVGLPIEATSWHRSRGLVQVRSGYTPDVRLASSGGISGPLRAIKKGGHRPTGSEPTYRGAAAITLYQRRPSL